MLASNRGRHEAASRATWQQREEREEHVLGTGSHRAHLRKAVRGLVEPLRASNHETKTGDPHQAASKLATGSRTKPSPMPPGTAADQQPASFKMLRPPGS